MTPLEKAKSNKGRVNYCDECEQFEIVGNDVYCKADGKLIHPIMLVRGQGTGAAWNCKKRRKPITNYDRIISKTPEELADYILKREIGIVDRLSQLQVFIYKFDEEKGKKDMLDWLEQEVDDGN